MCESDDRIAELRAFLKRGELNVHARHPDSQRTPLHFAAACGARAAVIALLQAESEPRAVCVDGRTPLDEAVASGHWGIVKLLLWMYADANAPPPTGASSLAAAAAGVSAASSPCSSLAAASFSGASPFADGVNVPPRADQPDGSLVANDGRVLGVILPACGAGVWSATCFEAPGGPRPLQGYIGATARKEVGGHGDVVSRPPRSVLLDDELNQPCAIL